MPAPHTHWTREQVLVALNLYCQLPFGRLDAKTPVIVKVAGLLGRSPGALAMKLSNIASLDPAITATGRSGLSGRSALDEQVWADFRANPEQIALESQELMDALVLGTDLQEQLASDAEFDAMAPATEAATSSLATIKVRKGQAFFRRAVLASYHDECCMSGLRIKRLLVASHIKPWNADVSNRLNPQNGLCLSALHDKAYDLGFISVRPDFTIAVSQEVAADPSQLIADSLVALKDQPIWLPNRFQPDKDFLDWHFSTLFRG